MPFNTSLHSAQFSVISLRAFLQLFCASIHAIRFASIQMCWSMPQKDAFKMVTFGEKASRKMFFSCIICGKGMERVQYNSQGRTQDSRNPTPRSAFHRPRVKTAWAEIVISTLFTVNQAKITCILYFRKAGHSRISKDYPIYCLPQNCLLVGNPEVGNSEHITYQDCLP